MKIDQQEYDKIAAEIPSDSSPVRIAAKKTHTLILHLPVDIDKRLKRLEASSKIHPPTKAKAKDKQ